jgi:spore coat protein CotH
MQEPIARGFTNGWGVEYCSTTDTEWVRTSMNNLINFINSNDGYQFRRGIGKYLDVEAAIDVMLYTYVIAAFDNSAKNILYVTYDGVKWIPSMYDMDGTFGMYWNGTFISGIQDMTPGFRSDGSVTDNVGNNLWQKLFDNYKAEIKARYFELREGALSMTNIEKRFDEFFASVPQILYDAEQQRWPSAPGRGKNNRNQIITFTRDRLNYLDSVFNQM